LAELAGLLLGILATSTIVEYLLKNIGKENGIK